MVSGDCPQFVHLFCVIPTSGSTNECPQLPLITLASPLSVNYIVNQINVTPVIYKALCRAETLFRWDGDWQIHSGQYARILSKSAMCHRKLDWLI